MRIVWDEPKRQANLAKHAMDFADLDIEFFASAIYRSSHSGRMLAIGWHGDSMVVAVVLRTLGVEAISMISMRAASKAERKLYDKG